MHPLMQLNFSLYYSSSDTYHHPISLSDHFSCPILVALRFSCI